MVDKVARFLCHEESFGIEEAWYSQEPVFSRCFYNSILYLPLALYVFIYVPIRVMILLMKPRPSVPSYNSISRPQSMWMMFLLIISLGKLTLIFHQANWSLSHQIPAIFVSRLIEVATFIIGLIFVLWHGSYHINTSPSLTFISFFYLVSSALHATLTLTQSFTFSSLEQTLIWVQLFGSFLNFKSQGYSTLRPTGYTTLEDDESHPYLHASTMSRLTFTWLNSLINGRWTNGKFTAHDLPAIMPEHRSIRVPTKFHRFWTELRRSSSKKKQSVLIALVRAYGVDYLVAISTGILFDIGALTAPVILKWLLSHLEDTDHNIKWHGYLIALAFYAVLQMQSFAQNFSLYRIASIAVHIRSALITLIYRKSLLISDFARGGSTTGEIVNLMSVDADNFTLVITWLDTLWSGPIRIIVSIYFIYQEIGASVFAGVAVIIIMIPFSAIISKFMEKLQRDQMKQKDERIKLINELIKGIKVIKLNAWEIPFTLLIQGIRKIELSKIQRLAYCEAVSMFTFASTPMLVALASFLTYMLIDSSHQLDANKAFISLAYFNIMRIPLTNLPYIFIKVVASRVSISRINRFLNLPVLQQYVTRDQSDDGYLVTVSAGNFNYGEDKRKSSQGEDEASQSFELKNINMKIYEGSLIAIVGQVGSGKSSLISAILGEMRIISGSVNIVPDKPIAYVPQQAWIQNDTLRNNILFGQTYNESKYRRIISACQLLPDLKILPLGDLTEIGEKGINLSGGQKQRLALARACYSDADLHFLDDPLSAVDAHVAKKLFDQLISTETGLLGKKTRILVTNDISLLPKVDCIYVMSNGTISESGKYDQLIADEGEFSHFIHAFTIQRVISKTTGADTQSTDVNGVTTAQVDHRTKVEESARSISEEPVNSGNISFRIYLIFFKSISLLSITVFCFILTQAFDAGDNYWLSLWASDGNKTDDHLSTLRISVYGALGAGQVIFILIGTLVFARGVVICASEMHSLLLTGILYAPMGFFDATPSGRIINRFSKDIDTIDEALPNTLNFWMMIIIRTIATFFVIIFVAPSLILFIIIVCGSLYIIQEVFVPVNRQLRRIISATRSPIYSHFSETLTGISTIRAYAADVRFFLDCCIKLDVTQSATLLSAASNRLPAVILQFLGNSLTVIVAFLCVAQNLSPALAGLSITYAMSMTQLLNWIVTMTTDLETNMVSVERIVEYSELEREGYSRSDSFLREQSEPPPEWPMNGHIEFKSYSTFYSQFGPRFRRNFGLVLKDLNLTINGGEKIGIVGRTGAGKSTLALSIFRLIEPASGSIVIDGIDISKIGLRELRDALTIIPQDPVLFSGKLRINLDPFQRFPDDQLWKALELAHLKDFVSGLDGGLDHNISEGGGNLSVGQRQLVCLARALLKKTKILVLDEATAAIDLQTDSLIQSTVRSEFSDCTILTIAHRLNTIMDSDKILVLADGSVVEFAPPKQLLEDETSQFRSLAEAAGLI